MGVTARQIPLSVPILYVMTDERPNRTPAVVMAATSKLEPGGAVTSGVNMGAESRLSTIRQAVQELHDASLEQFRQLLIARNSSSHRTILDGLFEDEAAVEVADAMATDASGRGLPGMAKLIRAGVKFGIITIIATIIGAPVEHEVYDFMGWNPPPVQVVRQMSPRQLDQLAQDIEHQMEQWEQRQEADRDHGPGRKAEG